MGSSDAAAVERLQVFTSLAAGSVERFQPKAQVWDTRRTSYDLLVR